MWFGMFIRLRFVNDNSVLLDLDARATFTVLIEYAFHEILNFTLDFSKTCHIILSSVRFSAEMS